MEYLWVLNGAQEGLIAAGANLDACGSFNSDYVNWANRLFLIGAESRVDTFESCDECVPPMPRPCAAADECEAGEICVDGQCAPEPVDPGVAPNGCPNDCTGCFDGNACRATNEWWTCGEAETVCGFARVEINVDMNTYGADQAPNVQGEFNGWCGDCSNTAADPDGDGIYTFLQYLGADNWEWKPTIGAWQVISSAPAECSRDQENNNYHFDVAAGDVNSGETVVVGPVCFADGFGTCGACEGVQPPVGCAADEECPDGQICVDEVCADAPVDPGAAIVSLTFDDAASIDAWQAVADAAAEDRTWVDGGGVEGGAMRIAAANAEAVGRAYIFQYVDGAVAYNGQRNVVVSFDAKLDAPLVASALHAQMELPGVGVINEFDLQNRGLNDAEWTTLSFPIDNIDPNGTLFRIHFNFAAGAVEGAGGALSSTTWS